MFSFFSETSLPGPEAFGGMAFDGCHFFLTVRENCRIVVLDREFCFAENIRTVRPYGAITFDPERDCFWAASSQCWFALFQLDRCFREIGRLVPCFECCCPRPITGVSFCCENGPLLVSWGNKILQVDPADGTACLLREEVRGAQILALVCLWPQVVYCVLRGSCLELVTMTCDGCIQRAEPLPMDLGAAALLVLPEEDGELLVLTNSQGCCSRLRCAHWGEDCCCKEPCGEECPCPPPCPCADILESIALVEAAMAHILNAEGEKLQKAVEIACTPCELLCVNASVQRTIRLAVQLELSLLSKLEAMTDGCCDDQ